VNWLWFREEVPIDFGAVEVRSRVRGQRLALWMLVLSLGLFFSWAEWAEIDEVTRARGSVIASSKTKVVQSPEPGIVAEINVVEGSRVEQGELVVALQKDQTASELAEVRAEKASLSAVQSRLRAEIDRVDLNFPPDLMAFPSFTNTQRSLYETRRKALDDEVNAIDAIAKNVERELGLLRPLLANNDVAEVDVIRLERQLDELRGQASNTRNRFYRDSAAELSTVEEQLASVEQRLNQSKDRLSRTELRAPVNGIVKNLAVTTVGGVVRPGEVLLEILPLDDSLILEVEIPPSEIAFVDLGMPATIKMDAYDYTIFGDLDGELVYLSPDTLLKQTDAGSTPYYRAQVQTLGKRFSKRPDFEFNIIPGMTATVEIKTGSNTVLNYLIKPLTKTIAESFSER
jgi:adhesin transport system membrane fusion protein